MVNKRSETAVAMPDSVWDGYDFTSIHAAVLFADLENSVMISSALSMKDYDMLISTFQSSLHEFVESSRKKDVLIGDYSIAGDQLAMFFFDPSEVYRNWCLDGPDKHEGKARQEIIDTSVRVKQELAVHAFKTAVQLKTRWLTHEINLKRVLGHCELLGLGIGLHYGRVFLRNRYDNKNRVEGYAVNLGKRIEGFSRQGHFSHIMLSQQMRDALRAAIVKHTQLRQRVFFHQHLIPLEVMKGVALAQTAYELKFYHRIGVHITPEAVEQYEALFALDNSNIWAYYQLVDYYAYECNDWDRAFELVQRAALVHPNDEKVQYDLARCYLQQAKLEQSAFHAEASLSINPDFDLSHEHLATIALRRENTDAQILHQRHCIRLSPSSPVNNLNLGLALLKSQQQEEGVFFIKRALALFPEYTEYASFQSIMRDLAEDGLLPPELQLTLHQQIDQAG